MRLQTLEKIVGQKNEGDMAMLLVLLHIKLMQMEKPTPLLNTGWEVRCSHFIIAFGGQRVAGWGDVTPSRLFFSCSYIR